MTRAGCAALLALCCAAPGCHDASAPPPSAPEVVAPEPAVVTVEDVALPEAPSDPASNASSETGPIKVGILHSLSGSMALAGSPARVMAEMTLAELNAAGGVLGRTIEPVTVDAASDWPRFAEVARELLTKENLAVIFGGETSVSRKVMLPVVEELNGLLFYPAHFEGQELSCNVYYTGMTPSQQGVPALGYLMRPEGGGYRRFVFIGTDYVLSRTLFLLFGEYAKHKGLAASQTLQVYTPFGHTDYASIVSQIAKFGTGAKTAIVSSLWGDSSAAFHDELTRGQLRMKVLHLSLDDYQLQGDAVHRYVGSLSARSYFKTPGIAENARFESEWSSYLARSRPDLLPPAPIEDIMEATHVGIRLWKLAVEQAGSTEVEHVRKALPKVKLKGPMGVELAFDENHSLTRPLFIGRLHADRSYDLLWQSSGALPPEPFNRYHPEQYQRQDRALTALDRCATR